VLFDVDSNPPVTQLQIEAVQICLRVKDEQFRLTASEYEDLAFRVDSQA
jgi:hypothetical protein